MGEVGAEMDVRESGRGWITRGIWEYAVGRAGRGWRTRPMWEYAAGRPPNEMLDSLGGWRSTVPYGAGDAGR